MQQEVIENHIRLGAADEGTIEDGERLAGKLNGEGFVHPEAGRAEAVEVEGKGEEEDRRGQERAWGEVRHAEADFSGPGWRSDQGNVYVRLGHPPPSSAIPTIPSIPHNLLNVRHAQ